MTGEDAGGSVALSLYEVKIAFGCMVEAMMHLEDWEYDIKVGVERSDVQQLVDRLKNVIVDSGFWGVPLKSMKQGDGDFGP